MNEEQQIKQAIEDSMEEIKAIDEELFMEMAGVAHAMAELRKALDKLDHCLDQRKFHDAANLGYRDISSEFIFLQRTLGGLSSAACRKESLISEIAVRSGVGVYEKVAPSVDTVMGSSKVLTAEEKALNKKKSKEMAEKFKSKSHVLGKK